MKPDPTAAAKAETKQCKFSHACLDQRESGQHSLCTVQRVDGENVCFVKMHERKNCPYALYLGTKPFCRCPLFHALQVQGDARV